jgi:hypothetical protein
MYGAREASYCQSLNRGRSEQRNGSARTFSPVKFGGKTTQSIAGDEEDEEAGHVHEKTSAAAAPRKPKKGAVSSPLNTDDIFPSLLPLPVLPLRRE